MITFIHTADTHFGMENYGKIDPKTGIHSRLLDFEKAFSFCIDTALEKNVDFFLFCGDAYKTTNPTPTQQKLLLNCFLRLYKANIPVVIIIGNHDNPLSFGKAHSLDIFDNLPIDGFNVITKPKILKLKTKSGPVQIVGIPWPTKNSIAISNKCAFKSSQNITDYICTAVGQIIESLANELDTKTPSIFAGHLTVSTGIFSGSEKRAIYGNDPTFLPSQLTIKPFDYIALGHLHRHQNLNKDAYPPIVYPGSIERVDFGERKEEKGFCLVTIEKKGATRYEFIKTPTRNLVQIDIKLKEKRNQTDQIINELKKQDIKNAIVKIIYHVPEQEKDNVDLQKINQACSEAMYLASIVPIRKKPTREKRSDLKISMNFENLLSSYFDTKPQLKDKKKTLVEKAVLLYKQSKNPQKET